MPEPSTPTLLERAQAAIAANDPDEANELLLKLVSADPQNEQAWLLLADVAPEVRQSMACLERVLALNPGNVQAQQWLALAQAAEAGSSSAASRQDNDRRPVPPLGDYLIGLGFVDAAQVQLALRVQADEEKLGQRRSLGEILVAQARITPAQLDLAVREQLRDVYSLFVD